MQIIWHGQSCFEIIGQVKIVMDPYSEEIGLKLPKMEADILLSTHSHYDHDNLKGVGPARHASQGDAGGGSPFAVTGPGEYEVKGVYIKGIPAFHDEKKGGERGENTIYLLDVEDIKICHLGDFGQQELSDDQLEAIGQVDILMIPVGGVYTISSKEALKIMSQLEPKITIPMHYAVPKLKVKLEELSSFLKAAGVKTAEPLPKLSLKRKDLPDQEAKIIVLAP